MSPSSPIPAPPPSNPGRVKSLQEISATKAFEVLLKDKNAVQIYNSLDSTVQQVLFPFLWQDYSRLRESERKYKAIERRTPPADRHIHFHNTSDNNSVEISDDEEDKDVDMVEDSTSESDCSGNHDHDNNDDMQSEDAEGEEDTDNNDDPYARRNHFRSKWKYRTNESDRGLSDHFGEPLEWDEGRLLITSNPERPFELCCCPQPGPQCEKAGMALSNFISSQLLYYRIAAVFGMPPPPQELPLTSCWGVELRFCANLYSVLYVEDRLGGTNLYFYGTQEASSSAIDLLNYLVSNEVPHPFHSFLAGRRAPDAVYTEA